MFRPECEQLENRDVMSTVTVANVSALLANGTPGQGTSPVVSPQLVALNQQMIANQQATVVQDANNWYANIQVMITSLGQVENMPGYQGITSEQYAAQMKDVVYVPYQQYPPGVIPPPPDYVVSPVTYTADSYNLGLYGTTSVPQATPSVVAAPAAGAFDGMTSDQMNARMVADQMATVAQMNQAVTNIQAQVAFFANVVAPQQQADLAQQAALQATNQAMLVSNIASDPNLTDGQKVVQLQNLGLTTRQTEQAIWGPTPTPDAGNPNPLTVVWAPNEPAGTDTTGPTFTAPPGGPWVLSVDANGVASWQAAPTVGDGSNAFITLPDGAMISTYLPPITNPPLETPPAVLPPIPQFVPPTDVVFPTAPTVNPFAQVATENNFTSDQLATYFATQPTLATAPNVVGAQGLTVAGDTPVADPLALQPLLTV